jgi:hypothetical protein
MTVAFVPTALAMFSAADDPPVFVVDATGRVWVTTRDLFIPMDGGYAVFRTKEETDG